MTSEGGKIEYDLVMPFVVCRSNGGPYEDEAFVAGYALGALDLELRQAAEVRRPVLNRTVRTDSLPQVELLAMRHGFLSAAEPSDGVPEWSTVSFTVPALEEV